MALIKCPERKGQVSDTGDNMQKVNEMLDN